MHQHNLVGTSFLLIALTFVSIKNKDQHKPAQQSCHQCWI